jgi:hypothetical protein
MLELTQKSERTIQGLEVKVSTLEREVSTHHAGVEELNREHRVQMDALREEKAMLEVSGCGLAGSVWFGCIAKLAVGGCLWKGVTIQTVLIRVWLVAWKGVVRKGSGAMWTELWLGSVCMLEVSGYGQCWW